MPQWRLKLGCVILVSILFVVLVRKFDVISLSLALVIVLPVVLVTLYLWFVVANVATLSGMVFRNNEVVGEFHHSSYESHLQQGLFL